MTTCIPLETRKNLLLNLAKCFHKDAILGYKSLISITKGIQIQKFELAIQIEKFPRELINCIPHKTSSAFNVNLDDAIKEAWPEILIRPGHFVSFNDLVGNRFKLNEEDVIKKTFTSLKRRGTIDGQYNIKIFDKNDTTLTARTFEELLVNIELKTA